MARDRLAELNSNTQRDYDRPSSPRTGPRDYNRPSPRSEPREYSRPSSPRSEPRRQDTFRNDYSQDSSYSRNDSYSRSDSGRLDNSRNTYGRERDLGRDPRSDVRSDVSRGTSRTAYSNNSPAQDNYKAGPTASKGQTGSYSDKIDDIQDMLGQVGRKLRTLESMQAKSITMVGERETSKITKDISLLSDEISDIISDVRSNLNKLSSETKSINGPEKQSRKIKESNLAKDLIGVANEFSSIQNAFKEKCRQRMEREIKIARPNASPAEVEQIMNDPQGSVFQKETLGRTRHVLTQLQNRHKELEQLEASIEELAQIFYDMQVLLQQQQETIDVAENYINDVSKNLEDGSGEITKAIVYRQNSRKKLWCLFIFVIVLLAAGGGYAYYNFVYLKKASNVAIFSDRFFAIKMTIQTKKLVGLDSQQNQLNELLKRTVSFGESNSVLVTGQKGSGKTTLVNNALASLSNHTFYTIKLDGIYHTDDALALKSIIRQLQLELDLETQTTGSFAERLEFVISTLKSVATFEEYLSIAEELGNGMDENVGKLLKDKQVKNILSVQYEWDKSIPNLVSIFSMVSQYQLLNGKYPTSKIFADLIDVKNQDQMEQTIHELSILEICILLSIKGLLSKQHELFNFEMVYDEYREFAKRLAALGKGMGRLHFTKSVALKAYENLACLGLICNSSGIASQCPKEYHMARCLLTRLQIRNALATYPDVLPSAIMKWAET
ncbi:origin recognition complex subunit 4 [Boothiomyces sp. JEL0838]|nr:origin recognition complex subunit 4 [Boothiomyces sp. JEL0838]